MNALALVQNAGKEFAAGNLATGLAALVDAYRALPTAELADAVERLSAVAETSRKPVEGKTAKDRLAAATRLLKSGDAVDLPRIYRVLPSLKSAEANQLAVGLVARPADPRALRQVAALLADPPWTSSASHKFWRLLLAHVAGDPRAATVLGAVKLQSSFGGGWAADAIIDLVKRALAKAKPVAATTTAELHTALAALQTKVDATTGTGDELLAKIHAQPDDLSLRAVYADWLVEKDDPRGEFISLQLARGTTPPDDAQRKREKELLDLHRDEWLGPLAPAAEGVRFQHGFLDAIQARVDRALTLVGEPSWATVTTLDLYQRDAPDVRPLLRPGMTVGGVSRDQLDMLTEKTSSLRGLLLHIPNEREGFTAADRDAIGRLTPAKFPSLTELGVDGYWCKPSDCRFLWKLPLAAQLRRFRFSGGLAALPALLKENLPSTLTALEVSFNNGWNDWQVELTRGSDGKFSHLDAVLRPPRSSWHAGKLADIIEKVLDEVDVATFESFHVRVDGVRATSAETKAVAAAAARQTRLQSLQLPGMAAKQSEAVVAEERKKGPAKKVKDVRAAQVKDAKATSRQKLAATLAKLPQSPQELTALDVDNVASMERATAFLTALHPTKGPTKSIWDDVATAILSLDDAPPEGRNQQRALRCAALGVLERQGSPGFGARLVEVLSRPTTAWQDIQGRNDNSDYLGSAELPAMFDWFESLRGKSGIPAHAVYYWIRALATRGGNRDTKKDLQKRLSDGRKLNSHQRWAYENAVSELK